MPIYRYSCLSCGSNKKVSRIKGLESEVFCGDCGDEMIRVLSEPMARSMETRDEYRNKSVVDDVEKMVDKRASEYFKKHELPRMIADHGEGWARERGLIDEDGDSK